MKAKRKARAAIKALAGQTVRGHAAHMDDRSRDAGDRGRGAGVDPDSDSDSDSVSGGDDEAPTVAVPVDHVILEKLQEAVNLAAQVFQEDIKAVEAKAMQANQLKGDSQQAPQGSSSAAKMQEKVNKVGTKLPPTGKSEAHRPNGIKVNHSTSEDSHKRQVTVAKKDVVDTSVVRGKSNTTRALGIAERSMTGKSKPSGVSQNVTPSSADPSKSPIASSMDTLGNDFAVKATVGTSTLPSSLENEPDEIAVSESNAADSVVKVGIGHPLPSYDNLGLGDASTSQSIEVEHVSQVSAAEASVGVVEMTTTIPTDESAPTSAEASEPNLLSKNKSALDAVRMMKQRKVSVFYWFVFCKLSAYGFISGYVCL